MPSARQLENARARQTLYAALRGFFAEAGYLEVETPCLVPAPGMEPHIDAFRVPFIPETGVGTRRDLYLHSSPEYAMKRLLADGVGPIFQLARVFRNGEVAAHHNPEFTMLEFYRPHADYGHIMADLEGALAAAARTLRPQSDAGRRFAQTPYERLTVRDALLRHTGVDLRRCPDTVSLRAAAEGLGVRCDAKDGYDDVFFRIFLEKVEPKLGRKVPTFLIEYPASMAALARLKPDDPSVAERVELFVDGMELANGYSELTDPDEQRRRLLEERALRERLGRPAYPLDERFLQALPTMPPSGGIAVGLDRVLMLLTGTERISDVLLFPAHEFLEET